MKTCAGALGERAVEGVLDAEDKPRPPALHSALTTEEIIRAQIAVDVQWERQQRDKRHASLQMQRAEHECAYREMLARWDREYHERLMDALLTSGA